MGGSIEQEYPELDELVIAVVRKILPYGAFCTLPEYGGLEAFLHISQVSTGWVKNIHEFLSEGRQYVVKVIRIDKNRGQVDVSLRQVSEDEKKRKLESVQQEKRFENIIKVALKNAKSKLKFEDVKKRVEAVYENPYDLLVEASEKGTKAFAKIKLPKKVINEIIDLAKRNIKKPTVTISGTINLTCYENDGVKRIKNILNFEDKHVSITYLGAPKYRVSVTAPNYKKAEEILSKILSGVESKVKKIDCEFSFERDKN